MQGTRKRGFFPKNTNGVSIPEVLIALAIVVIVLGGIYLLLLSGHRVYARGQVSFDVHTNARFAVPAITRALLSAGRDPTQAGGFGFADNTGAGYVPVASDTQVTFTLDADGDGVLQNNAAERKGFRRAGAGPPYTLEQMVIDGVGTVTWRPLALQIQNVQFSYFDAGGNPLPNPATPPYTLTEAQRGVIRRIVIEVTVAETGTGILGSKEYTYRLSSDATPRNLRGL